MHRTILLILTFSLLFSVHSTGQADSTILLKVNSHEVTSGEFVRLFLKSNVITEESSIDDYLSQFIIFRLKVEQAMAEGMDTTEAFRRELRGYRNQLAKNYLTDNEAREKLLKDIYTRLLTEINAWHILVACQSDASPNDTLDAYKRSIELRARLEAGELFENVARGGSDDPSVVVNGGNLGYFTAMQMIKPFEDAAYKLRTGELSMPVRTPYGYHIIRVTDKRPSQGTIKVAHIMKSVPPGSTEEVWNKAADEINSILKQLNDGSQFAELAKSESDHLESSTRGGEMDWFRTGDIVPEFSMASFSLLRNGDISPPVKTSYGWHIIKRIDRKPVGSFEENRQYIESRLTIGTINDLARNSFVNKLKKEYNFSLNNVKLNQISSLTDSLIANSSKKFERGLLPAGNLYTYRGGALKCIDFAQLIERNLAAFNGTNTSSLINTLLENNVSETLIAYEDSKLEDKYPEFRYLVKEFHDGMLLFEINSREIWNKPYTDTLGLYQFYEQNHDKFMTRQSALIKIYAPLKPLNIKSLSKLVVKNGSKPGGDEKILARYIDKNDTTLSITTRSIYAGDEQELDQVINKKGTSTAILNNQTCVVRVMQVFPPELLPVHAVQLTLTELYQESLEEKWLEQLKNNYPVWINEEAFRKLREKYYENR